MSSYFGHEQEKMLDILMAILMTIEQKKGALPIPVVQVMMDCAKSLEVVKNAVDVVDGYLTGKLNEEQFYTKMEEVENSCQ